MKTFLMSLLAVVSLCAIAHAGIKFGFNYKKDVTQISEKTIELMVSHALGLEESKVPYFQAIVDVYGNSNGETDYLVVNLYHSDCYLVTVYRLDIKGSKVVAVIPDYIEESGDEKLCGTCPDPNVEILISYIEDALFPGAIQHGWGTWSMAQGAGLNAALVIGYNESKQTILNYLACPKLKAWGRIGHGTRDAIQMNDYKGKITASELAGLTNDIKGKTFIFNSCLCHNDPFEPAMINAGAYFFAAGDISLSGGKEGVFSSFFNKVIKDHKELTKAMDEAIAENNYPNAWGYSGAGQAPYYLQFGVTDVSTTNPVIHDGFSILITTNRVMFMTDAASPESMISIFNPAGKIIYQNMLSGSQCSWNLTATQGQKVTGGTYIAVLKDQTGINTFKKMFTVAK